MFAHNQIPRLFGRTTDLLTGFFFPFLVRPLFHQSSRAALLISVQMWRLQPHDGFMCSFFRCFLLSSLLSPFCFVPQLPQLHLISSTCHSSHLLPFVIHLTDTPAPRPPTGAAEFISIDPTTASCVNNISARQEIWNLFITQLNHSVNLVKLLLIQNPLNYTQWGRIIDHYVTIIISLLSS